jgi:hypothetical protein
MVLRSISGVTGPAGQQLDRLYGPRPGQPYTSVVLVEDDGPIHTSKLALAALAAQGLESKFT